MATAPNGKDIKVYFLNFLEEADANEAWILSETYIVNQLEKIISGIEVGTTIDAFSENVTLAPEATMMVYDKDGNEKSSGEIEGDDMLKVTSGNGVNSVMFDLNIVGTEAFVNSELYDVDQDAAIISNVQPETQVSDFLAQLIPAIDASMMVINVNGDEVPSGMLESDYQLKVVSGNEMAEKLYNIEFADTNSQAFVTSSVYDVNQTAEIISNIPDETSLDDFKANLTLAAGASMAILDANEDIVTSGNVEDVYTLKVLSGNGKNEKVYNITVGVSISNEARYFEISLYPNPSKDVLYVEGVSANQEIIIRNILGETIKMLQVNNDEIKTIQLDKLSSGVYFITVVDRDNKLMETMKFIKR